MKIVHESTMYISIDDYKKCLDEYKENMFMLDKEASQQGFYLYLAQKYGMYYNRHMKIVIEEFNFFPDEDFVDKILKEDQSEEMVPLKKAYDDGYKDGRHDGLNPSITESRYNDSYPYKKEE